MIEIKSRYDDSKILYTAESAADVRTALEEAVKHDAYLHGANLHGANLDDAYLGDANLDGAYLGDANLHDANLHGAYLGDAYLRGANLHGANLGDAYLRGANLHGANLGDAYLGGANAYKHPLWRFYVDFMAVLDSAPAEVAGLRAALLEGRIDGSTYTGECACLVGTIAKVRGVDVNDAGALEIDKNADRPAEQWFVPIGRGDTPTPEGQPFPGEGAFRATLALRWLDEWVESRERIGRALIGPVDEVMGAKAADGWREVGADCADDCDPSVGTASESSGGPYVRLSAVLGTGQSVELLVDGEGVHIHGEEI